MKITRVNLRGSDSLIYEISSFLENNDGASIFHTPQWNQIVEDVFKTRFLYLVASEGNKIIGVMPCHIVRRCQYDYICYTPPRLYEVSYGGPVAAGDALQRSQISRKLVCAAGRLKIGIAVSLFNSPGNTDWTESIDDSNNSNWHKKEFETAYVDMSMSLEEIWQKSITGKKRNMIRKAEKNGIEVEVGGVEMVDIYFELIQQMSRRTGIAFHSKEYYRRVMETFAPQDMARIYVSKYMGEYLSGGIFLRYGQICYHWHGVSGARTRNMGQGELIQWHVIRWAKESGCRWYDLVGVERERMPSLAKFKMSFTKNLVPFHNVSYRRLVDAVARRIGHTIAHASGQ